MVKIRLARHGQKKRPFYRIVVAQSDARRDGRFLEIVGTYNPMTEPATVTLKEDRLRYWAGVGALPTTQTQRLVEKQLPGLFVERFTAQRGKIQARRKARKQRQKAAA